MSEHHGTRHDPDGPVAPEVQSSLATALERGTDTALARPARRRRAVVALSVAAAVAGVVVAVSVAGPSDGPVDIVGEARAALSPQHELVHYVLTEAPVKPSESLNPMPRRGPCVQTGRFEVWQTTVPDRWRAVLPANPRGPRCTRTSDRHGHEITGPTEVAWDRGTTRRYQPGLETLDIVRGHPANSSARNVPVGDQRLGTGDPVAVLRRLLASGTVRDTGGATLDGRAVRVLKGTVEDAFGRGTMITKLTYAVDAETFSPVRVITTTILQDADFSPRSRNPFSARFGRRLDFTVYEHLPLTRQTERLLEIRPAGPTDTTDQTLAELRRDLKRENGRRK